MILALWGDHRGAITEITRLDRHLEGLEEDQKLEVEGQNVLIAGIISEARRVADRKMMGRVERNERCPCGSGLKFKKCHGA